MSAAIRPGCAALVGRYMARLEVLQRARFSECRAAGIEPLLVHHRCWLQRRRP